MRIKIYSIFFCVTAFSFISSASVQTSELDVEDAKCIWMVEELMLSGPKRTPVPAMLSLLKRSESYFAPKCGEGMEMPQQDKDAIFEKLVSPVMAEVDANKISKAQAIKRVMAGFSSEFAQSCNAFKQRVNSTPVLSKKALEGHWHRCQALNTKKLDMERQIKCELQPEVCKAEDEEIRRVANEAASEAAAAAADAASNSSRCEYEGLAACSRGNAECAVECAVARVEKTVTKSNSKKSRIK